MIRTSILSAVLCAATATPLFAQEFSGGTLGIETALYADDLTVGTTTYFGSAEIALPYGISLGANGSYYGLSALDSDARNLTLHGFYDLGGIDVGAFYAIDDNDAGTNSVYGIEGAADLGGAIVSGYLGRIDGDTSDGTLAAIRGGYDLTREISANAELGLADLDAGRATRLSVGGSYALTEGLDLYGDLGRILSEDTVENTTFISLGARIVLGPDRGTTFGTRSVLDLIPDF